MTMSRWFRWRDVTRLPAWVVRQWNKDFRDARVILEQDGDLRYLVVPASLQRRATRGAILLVTLTTGAIVALGSLSTALHLGKARLEYSHQQIYSALLVGTDDLDQEAGFELDRNDMLSLAMSIRERNQQIRAMVSEATGQLDDENHGLSDRLAKSGLTERAIKIIQSAEGMGGPFPQTPERLDPLLRDGFIDVSARNRELKDILFALPHQIPLQNHRITSSYGVRVHPISRRPQLHAGVDLVPTDNDDRVFPSLPGRVILARDYNNYGKTVIVKHERGIESLYAHLDQIHVKEGQEVDITTVLGMVGNTGASTGKHLHFEISVGGYPVDPLKVIATAQYVQQAQVQNR
jgi:murein DD-endopeptidase MepM/ murein hydrolase activator NlpD